MIPLALALALLGAQDAAPRPAQDGQRAPRNPILEGVAVQAGEDLVTLGEFERAFQRLRESEPPETREGELQLQRKALLELWTDRLEAQKGADLGLDPEQIARISRANLEEEREKAGLDAYLAQLRAEKKDALSEESDRQKEVQGAMWRYSTLGYEFAAKRATRDTGIRPGELRAMFAENRENLAPTTVELRFLVVSSEQVGGADAARELCEDARARVLAGEDLALLVEEHGADLRESRGLLPFRRARDYRDPRVVEFAERAEIGELSEVMAIPNPRTGQPDPELGYELVQLNDRDRPEPPDFDEAEVQGRLRQYFTKQRNELILERGRALLRRESYSWVNPLLEAARAQPGPDGQR